MWKRREIEVTADSALGESVLESRSLGLRGLDDASVYRWRRSNAADAAAAQLGRLCQRGEPGSGDRGVHRGVGPCRLGFSGMTPAATGRPAYHPSALLKIYLYGYLNRVQSSRRLERETQRNIELMWLTGRLMPDFKTIADFRKDNGAAIQSVCRQFVELCRKLGLFTRAVVAIDGSKFKAVNNRDKNYTVAKVTGRMEQVDASIARYLRALDQADREEGEVAEAKSGRLTEKIAGLRRQMLGLKAMEQRVQDAPDQQVSLTDPDARSMATSGKGTATVGYNVQIAVDAEHHLIVAHEVTNQGYDRQQLAPMAFKAQQATGCDKITALADRGYFNGD